MRADMRFGLSLTGLWALILVLGFVSYPKPDNLLWGYFVFILFGVDALGRLTLWWAMGIALIQLLIAFALGCGVQRIYKRLRRRT